jgi:hypothetical protein
VQYLLNVVWQGTPINVEKAWIAFQDDRKPSMHTGFKEKFAAAEKHQGFVRYLSWFDENVSGDSMKCAGLTNPTLCRNFMSAVTDFAGAPLFRQRVQKPGSKEDTTNHGLIYQMQYVVMKAGFASTGPVPFCVCEGRMVLEGKLMVAGVPFRENGGTYSEQLQVLTTASGAELAEKTKSSGFLIVYEAGDVLVVPVGFIVIVKAVTDCRSLRWGLHRRTDDDKHILTFASALVDSYPTLSKTTYGWWMKQLQIG